MDSEPKCFGCYQKSFITCTKWCSDSSMCKQEYRINHGLEDDLSKLEKIDESIDLNKEMEQNITKKKRGRPKKNIN